MENTPSPESVDRPETSIERERRVLALIDVVLVDASDPAMEVAIFNALKEQRDDEPIREFIPKVRPSDR